LQPLLTQQEVAEVLQVSLKTVLRMRQKGTGPRWVKVAGLVRYPEADLEEWIRQGGSADERVQAGGEQVLQLRVHAKRHAVPRVDKMHGA
jgi:excisionase family DNA binding protein